MAQVSSGSFVTTNYDNRSLTFRWAVADTSIAGNYTDINWSLLGSGTATGYKISGNFKVVIDGDTVYSSTTRIELWQNTIVANGTKRIYHDTTGNKTFSASAQAGIYKVAVNCSGSDSWELPTIPREAKFTQHGISSYDETSVKINWACDSAYDKLQYSLNGGSWVDVTGYPIYTVTGLSANTSYNIRTRVRRTDSQLYTISGKLEFTTWDYPHCIDTPNFTIGDRLLLMFYNPLNRVFNVSFIDCNGETLGTDVCGGISLNGYDHDTFISKLYASIPNASSGKYQVKVTYDGVSRIRNNGNTYTVKSSECTPDFNDFTYKDINGTVTNVTGNDQVLVKGVSNLQVTVSSANKMVAKNSATPSKYIATIDTLNKSVDYSESDITLDVGTVVNAGTKRLTVTAYDSRTISKAVYKDILVYDYSKPVINLEVSRLNNFEAQTTLKISGSYTPLIVDNEDKNAITSVSYRYREQEGEWSEWVPVNTTVTNNNFTCNDVILSLDNTKAFELEAKVIDKLSDNEATGSIDVGEAIFFISSNKKACYINGQKIIMYDVLEEW